MCFREIDNAGSKWTYKHVNAIINFHDANSFLHTLTNIYPKPGILLKVITVFRSENLALYKLTSIHSI